jgi:hypothetical protein
MHRRKVRALSEFSFLTPLVDKNFVEGEVAMVLFKSEDEFNSFVDLGLFEEVFGAIPVGIPDIPVLLPSLSKEEGQTEEDVTEEVTKKVLIEGEQELPLCANLDQTEEAVSKSRTVEDSDLEMVDTVEDSVDNVKDAADKAGKGTKFSAVPFLSNLNRGINQREE